MAGLRHTQRSAAVTEKKSLKTADAISNISTAQRWFCWAWVLLLNLLERVMNTGVAAFAACMSSFGGDTGKSKASELESALPASKKKSSQTSPPVSGSKSRKSSASITKCAEPLPVYIERDKAETPAEKRIRALRKKIREIDALQERAETLGQPVDAAAAEKVASKAELLKEVEALKVTAALEIQQAAECAAAEAAAAEAKAKAAAAAAARSAEGRAAAEAALVRKRRNALEVLPNISPIGEEAKTVPRVQVLLKQVSELSDDVFGEDCLHSGISKKKGWRLSLLARPVPEDPKHAPPEDPDVLLGFMVFRFRPDMQCISIAKIAVPKEHRGRGFGRHLMEWVTRYAQQQGGLHHVSLSSLPDAVKFYQAFGFKAIKIDGLRDDDEDYIEGQVYMEYRLKGGGQRQGPNSGQRRK